VPQMPLERVLFWPRVSRGNSEQKANEPGKHRARERRASVFLPAKAAHEWQKNQHDKQSDS